MKGASILPTVSAFAGRHSKGVSGRSADGEGALQFPHHDGSVTRAPRRRIEEGNRRLVRQSFTRVSSPISHSSHPQGWIVELGLPRWKRQGRTPHDESKWLAFDSSGDRGSAGTRAGPSGSVLRARIDRSKGCARASAYFRTWEVGTARKRAGIVAEVVWRRSGPEKRRAHHSQELVPRRDRGPSPRNRNSVATRCVDPRRASASSG